MRESKNPQICLPAAQDVDAQSNSQSGRSWHWQEASVPLWTRSVVERVTGRGSFHVLSRDLSLKCSSNIHICSRICLSAELTACERAIMQHECKGQRRLHHT